MHLLTTPRLLEPDRLIRARKLRGLTPRELAEKAGLSTTTIGFYEIGDGDKLGVNDPVLLAWPTSLPGGPTDALPMPCVSHHPPGRFDLLAVRHYAHTGRRRHREAPRPRGLGP